MLSNLAHIDTDPEALNYEEDADYDDGSCIAIVEGCTIEGMFNYDPNANVNDGSCSNLISEGCTDFLYIEYSSDHNVSDQAQCVTPIVPGCTNDQYLEYDASYNIGVDSVYCLNLIVQGCTNENAINYDLNALCDNNSCLISGCTNQVAINYNPNSNLDVPCFRLPFPSKRTDVVEA